MELTQVIRLLILFGSLGGLLLFLTRKLEVPLPVALPTLASFLICVLYFSDFLSAMFLTARALIAAGIIIVIFYVWQAWTEKGKLRAQDQYHPVEAGLFLFALAALLFARTAQGQYSSWDEFSHWGAVIRTICAEDTFHFTENPLTFQTYPPGTALFSYFVSAVLGFSEGGSYFSHSLLLVGFLAPVVATARRIGRLYALAAIALLYFLVFKLGHGWSSVLIDHVLAVFFGGTIVSYFYLVDNRKPLWPVAFMLGALVLVKDTGFQFAILAGILFIADSWTRPTGTPDDGPIVTSLWLRALKSTWVFLPIALTSLSWKWHVLSLPGPRAFTEQSIIGLAAKAIDCCSTPRSEAIAVLFFDYFFGGPPGIVSGEGQSLVKILFYAAHSYAHAPATTFLMLTLVGVGLGLCSPSSELSRRVYLQTTIMAAGGLAYCAGLFLFYTYAYSDYEASRLSDIQRYLKTYYLSWYIVALAQLFQVVSLCDKPALRNKIAAAVLILLAAINLTPGTLKESAGFLLSGVTRVDERRFVVVDRVREYARELPKSASVHTIWQGSNGYEYWASRYELLPRKIKSECWSFGAPQYEGDIWTCNYSEAQISKAFSDFDYIIVGKGLVALKIAYPDLFSEITTDSDYGLLRVEREGRDVKPHFVKSE